MPVTFPPKRLPLLASPERVQKKEPSPLSLELAEVECEKAPLTQEDKCKDGR
jgi:hypothetical protein